MIAVEKDGGSAKSLDTDKRDCSTRNARVTTLWMLGLP